MDGAGGREGYIYIYEKKVGTYNSMMGLTVLKIQSEGNSFHLTFKNHL